ncbi:hypothetical protein P8452_65904 [Trifolium repens]|nr:hypothetical protein P8452_65904 [Trifolium repens]
MSDFSNQQQDISNTHGMEPIKDICNINQPLNMICNNVASTSISNNSSPTFIDRDEAPFMPIGMVSYLPPLLEIESPLHSDTSIMNNSSPTFNDRGETYFIPMNMEPNLSPLPESINFQSFESPLIHKYPPLPLRPSEEIQQQQLEPDLPPLEIINFQSLDSPLIHKYPPLPLRSAEEIRQEQLESDSPSNNGLLESMVNFWYTQFLF